MDLNSAEKRTLFLLLLAAFFNGFVASAFQLQDVIAKKALSAQDWQVTILVMLWPLSNLFSIWWGKLLEHSRNPSGYFLLTAFLGRLPLVLMIFVSDFYGYLALLIILFSFNALISPAQNAIYQANFQRRNRGTVFGIYTSLQTFSLLVFSFIAGRILDLQESRFRYFFLVVALTGMISALIMSSIKVPRKLMPGRAPLKWREIFVQPVYRMLEVFKSNREFAIFERSFFIYGIGYMILLPVIPKFLVEVLQMGYSQTFLAKGVISQLAILILSPLAGRIFDRKNPVHFAALTFGFLGLYPGIMFLASWLTGYDQVNLIVYLGFLTFGIVMSAISVSWNISSIYFAGNEDVSMYQSVHVTLTGLRGLFAPFLGYLLLKFLGIRVVFLAACCFFLTASLLCWRQYGQIKKKFDYFPEPEK